MQEEVIGQQGLGSIQFIVRWHYSREDWEQTAIVEKWHNLRRSRVSALIGFAWLGGGGSTILLLSAPREDYGLFPVVIIAAIWFGVLFWAIGKRQAEKVFRKTLDSDPVILISETLICWGSECHPVGTLEKIREDNTPPKSLVFNFVTGTGRGRRWRERRALVPAGKEEEACRVMATLGRVANARK